MDIDGLREEIGRIDAEIAKLVSERTELAKKIGQAKKENGLPIRNLDAECRVKERYLSLAEQYGLSPETMESIAESLIREAVEKESEIPSESSVKKRIAVIGGAGKMGNWTKELFESSGHEVIVIDPSVKNGLSLKDCKDCNAVVVSVPIHLTPGIMKELQTICNKDTLIFDLTSLKTPVEPVLKEMAETMKVCSVHPMFGPSAKSLFNRNLIICDCGNPEAVKEANELFDNRGANIRIMDISEHDGYMSYVLGLTHAVNIALFTVLQRSGFELKDLMTVASTTFLKGLDTNKSVALEDPMLYYEIQHMNGHRDRMWNLFSDAVEDLRKASMSEDPEEFAKLMIAGKEYFTQ